jgi:hypothetical protein
VRARRVSFAGSLLTLTTMLAARWLGLRTRPIDAIGTGE